MGYEQIWEITYRTPAGEEVTTRKDGYDQKSATSMITLFAPEGTEVLRAAEVEPPENPEADPCVMAIRADPEVGRGTCSYIDECFSGLQLWVLAEMAGGTPEAAVKAARERESLLGEQESNAAWDGPPD